MTDARDLRPKLVGARIKRSEDPRLLRGRGRFVDDLSIADALHVAFRRSDEAHARIVAVDAGRARAAPGVGAALTAEDIAALHVPLVATSGRANYHATPILPLAHRKVRHVGEPVVAVLADSRHLAEDAAA